MIVRTKGKHNSTFSTDDFYKCYKAMVEKPLSKSIYNNIRKQLYEEITKEIYNSGEIVLPKRFGKIEILKKKRKITYNKDGSINKVNYKVDWKATKEYWKEKYPGLTPEQLKEIKGKPKVYFPSEWRYSFNYIKRNALYVNKNFTWMIISRNVARGLKDFVSSNSHIDYKEK